jgi:CubicO group peptidase (beta-lactamase class C family)
MKRALVTSVLMAAVMSLGVATPRLAATQASDGGTVSGAAAARVDAYLTKLVPYGFSGAVLIARDGQVVFKRAYGMANRAANLPYAVDMVSCIGSVTKQFTGAAIVKLEEMGKLKTADPISKYLPGVPADKATITIHHLLTHTAGFSGDLGGMDEEPIAREALLQKVLAAPLASTPGSAFEYSNEGFSLAAMIVERVSGQTYDAFLREHLWLPAGMKDTGYQLPAWPIERLPLGYRADGQPWGRVYKNGWLPDGPGWYLRGNGGVHASLDDLYRWHLALEKPGVLSADSLKKYLTGYAPAPGGEMYAYGWGVQKTRRGGTLITHNGGNGFLFTDFRRYVDDKTVIIAMSNEPVIPATQLAAREIDSLFFGDGPAVLMPPTAVAVTRADRDALVGTYALENGSTLTIGAGDGAASTLTAVSSDLTLLGGLPGLMPPGGRFADLETKTMAIMAEAAKDNFRPIFEAFNDDRPFEVVQGNQRRFWAGWRAELGEFKRFELLGVAPFQGDPGVTVRVEFARGAKTLQFMWGPRRLAGFRTIDAGAPVTLTPESATTWALYAYRAPALVRLTFSGANVTITTGDRTVKGTRRP